MTMKVLKEVNPYSIEGMSKQERDNYEKSQVEFLLRWMSHGVFRRQDITVYFLKDDTAKKVVEELDKVPVSEPQTIMFGKTWIRIIREPNPHTLALREVFELR